MKTKVCKMSIAAFFSLGLPLSLLPVHAQEPSAPTAEHYRIVDLGTLGGKNSVPVWITNTGDVIGYSETTKFDAFGNPIVHGFHWSSGVMQDLGTLGGNNSFATGGNDESQAAGIADVTGGMTSHAFLWYKGAMTDLGALSGPSGFSYAQLVNDEQQVVGGSTTAEGGFHAAVWDHGAITDLGTLPCPTSDCQSDASGINDLGQIVGGSQVDDVIDPLLGFPPFHAAMWTKGELLDLGAGPNGGIGSFAFNINNKSQVVGRFGLPDPNEGAVVHAFLWQNGQIQDLGVPANDNNSEANSLNDSGEIVGDSGVGFAESYSPDHALLWENGARFDLNTLIPSNSGYYLLVAFDVNASGQIVVCAVQQNTGNIHAALLAPQLNRNISGSLGTRAAALNPTTSLSTQARRLLALAMSLKSGHRPPLSN